MKEELFIRPDALTEEVIEAQKQVYLIPQEKKARDLILVGTNTVFYT